MNTSVTSMADRLPGRANTIAALPTAIREETLHSSYTSVTTKIPFFFCIQRSPEFCGPEDEKSWKLGAFF